MIVGPEITGQEPETRVQPLDRTGGSQCFFLILGQIYVFFFLDFVLLNFKIVCDELET